MISVEDSRTCGTIFLRCSDADLKIEDSLFVENMKQLQKGDSNQTTSKIVKPVVGRKKNVSPDITASVRLGYSFLSCSDLPQALPQRRYSDIALENMPTNLQRCLHTVTTLPRQESDLVIQAQSTLGRRRGMEDRNTDIKGLLSIPIKARNGQCRVPTVLQNNLKGLMNNSSTATDKLNETFDYIAVFDGHGGSHVSETLSKKLHVIIRDTLAKELEYQKIFAFDMTKILGKVSKKGHHSNMCKSLDDADFSKYTNKSSVTTTLCNFMTCQKRLEANDMHENIRSFWKHKNQITNINDTMLNLSQIEDCIVKSFLKMNEEFNKEECEAVGSTAIVTLISNSYIIVANVGDSRAVIFRDGSAFRLSRDQKPEDDEEDRIEEAGGRIWDFNGKRVMGLLAMSRAFGDGCLSEYGVIAEPEVTIINRSINDQFLIVACDGLWDVMTDKEACTLVSRCFQRATARGVTTDIASKVAANVLLRAALEKGSSDNITVYIIDLRPQDQSEDPHQNKERF